MCLFEEGKYMQERKNISLFHHKVRNNYEALAYSAIASGGKVEDAIQNLTQTIDME